MWREDASADQGLDKKSHEHAAEAEKVKIRLRSMCPRVAYQGRGDAL